MPYTALALNATTLCQLNHALALPIAAETGLTAVECSAGKGPRALIRPSASEEELSAWNARLRSHGLHALSLCGHRDLSQPGEAADFVWLMEKAADLGCRFLTTAVPDGCDPARYREGLLHAAQSAKRLGLSILLETHGYEHGTGASLLPYLLSEEIGICYDTGNVLFYGGVSPIEDLPLCISHVRHLHLKDKAGKPREWNFPALGTGMVDFPALFALDGWQADLTASIEVEFTPAGAEEAEVRAAVAASVQYLDSLQKKLYKRGMLLV